MPEHVLAPVRRPFRAMAEAFVPEAAELTGQQWARGEAAVEASLASRPDAVKRQLRLFVRAVNVLAVLRFGRWLASVPVARRIPLLESLERAPLLLVRRGVWGVRTLAFMAYYSLDEVRAGLGYRARPEGWEARRGEPAP